MEVEALSTSPPSFHFSHGNKHDSNSQSTDLLFKSDHPVECSNLVPSFNTAVNEEINGSLGMGSSVITVNDEANGRAGELAGESTLNNGDSGSDALATAVVRLQKSYRGYRTRRMLADSAVVAEELWWQAIDYARLNHSTISFFNFHETAASRWSRVGLNASKVGKGLSKDAKAQKLAFQHWIEAIDPRHRYGHNLHMYYNEWCQAESGQPFFYWLDIGDGKDLELKSCPRDKLRNDCILYLGPQEREYYEYLIIGGNITHKMTGDLLDTSGGDKWIFVMSTSKKLYSGVKKKGKFQHSSFLAGGAALAAGRLLVECGTLKSISAYSGHYRPTDDRLDDFLTFLKDGGVNLDEVEIHKNEDYSDSYEDQLSENVTATSVGSEESVPDATGPAAEEEHVSTEESVVESKYQRSLSAGLQSPKAEVPKDVILERINSKKFGRRSYSKGLGLHLSRKWSTGAGPRIGCVADYPQELRSQALEFVELSPRNSASPTTFRRAAGFCPPTSEQTSE